MTSPFLIARRALPILLIAAALPHAAAAQEALNSRLGAYLAGRIPKKSYATASSPLHGLIRS